MTGAETPPPDAGPLAEDRDLPPLAAAGSEAPRPATGKPMPRWVPLSLAGVLLAAGVAFALPIVRFGGDDAPEPTAEAAPAVVTPAQLEQQIAAARETAAAVAHVQAEAQAAHEAALAGLQQDLAAIRDDVRAVQAALARAREQPQAAPTPDDQDELLRAAIDSLAVQVDALATSQAKGQPAAAVARRPRPRRSTTVAAPPAPPAPFEVLAVDVWAGEPQLTIRDAAGSRLVAAGEAVGGWRIVDADAGRGALTLQTPAGTSARYTLAGTGLTPVPPPPLPTLTVAVEPADARVRVMNVTPPYRARMPLPAGAYDVLVDRAGYVPSRQWIRLDGDRTVAVRLAPESTATAAQ